jgi:hypothetical protein
MSETEKIVQLVVRVANQLKEEGKWKKWSKKRWQKVAKWVDTGELGVLGLTGEECKNIYADSKKKNKKKGKKEATDETKTTGEGETGEGVVRVPEDYKTLKEAAARVAQDPRITTIVLGEGEHKIDGNLNSYMALEISSAINIVGDKGVPKSEIVVVGGIMFDKGIPGNCHLEHLTLRQAKYHGVAGWSPFTMEDVLVEQCGSGGVLASGPDVVCRFTNVEVRQCGQSGVYAYVGASITLIGTKTTVHHNCTTGDSRYYGLQVYGASSTIQLVSPLTKEHLALENGGGGNWGAGRWANINQIKTIYERVPGTEVRVPEDYNTLKEAVETVHGDRTIFAGLFDDGVTTIVVGKGEHQIDGDYLQIASAINIVGDPGVPKSEIVVVGGIQFREEIKGNCHLEHLTLRQAKYHGVFGKSPFTMEDVLVEQCGSCGVLAWGPDVVCRFTNVEVRQCGQSGVYASYVASITLIGAKTTVHHNCTKGDSATYGLQVYGGSATIQLVSPLTKEQVSIDNGGGGNWGAEDDAVTDYTIRTVLSPSIQPLYTQLFAVCADRSNHAFGYFSETLDQLDGQGQLYVNYKNEQGLTMLTTACLNGQIEIIKFLMEMPQIDGTMTREQFIQCTGFPTTWLENGLKLNHNDAITLETTIDDCPVRCLPCKHPFAASGLLWWLKIKPTCPLCVEEVTNVELMSTELVRRWNLMDLKYTETGEEKYKFSSRYRQFVKTKL